MFCRLANTHINVLAFPPMWPSFFPPQCLMTLINFPSFRISTSVKQSAFFTPCPKVNAFVTPNHCEEMLYYKEILISLEGKALQNRTQNLQVGSEFSPLIMHPGSNFKAKIFLFWLSLINLEYFSTP